MKKIRIHIVIIFLVLFVFPFIAISQQASDKTKIKIDSLVRILERSKEDTNKVNILNKLSSELNYSDSKNAEKYALQALSLGEKLNFNIGIAQAYNNLGVFIRIPENIFWRNKIAKNQLEFTGRLKIVQEWPVL